MESMDDPVVGTERSFVGPVNPVVSWGGIWSGVVIGIAFMALFTSLWLALSFASHVSAFYSYLAWWIGAAAIAALVVAGFVSAVTSQMWGAASGLSSAVTTWSLFVLGALLVGIAALGVFGTDQTVTVGSTTVTVTAISLWSSFWSLLVGLAAVIIGGMVGGLVSGQEVPAGITTVETQRRTVPARSDGHLVSH